MISEGNFEQIHIFFYLQNKKVITAHIIGIRVSVSISISIFTTVKVNGVQQIHSVRGQNIELVGIKRVEIKPNHIFKLLYIKNLFISITIFAQNQNQNQ